MNAYKLAVFSSFLLVAGTLFIFMARCVVGPGPAPETIATADCSIHNEATLRPTIGDDFASK